jgi:hypothetical protein
MYKRTHPNAPVSIHQNTDAVPADGMYYVLQDGQVLGKFRTLKKASEAYKAALEAEGISPSAEGPAIPPEQGTSPSSGSRLVGDFYVYGKPRRRKTGTRTYG